MIGVEEAADGESGGIKGGVVYKAVSDPAGKVVAQCNLLLVPLVNEKDASVIFDVPYASPHRLRRNK